MNRRNYAYLFALLILPFLFACEKEADELQSNPVHVDGGYFDFTTPQVVDFQDFNGNKFYPNGTVVTQVSINNTAPDNYSKEVFATLSIKAHFSGV